MPRGTETFRVIGSTFTEQWTREERRKSVERRERAEALRKKRPSANQLNEWMAEGGCEAVDGCWVEPDGTCEHGCPSWLVEMGLI